jgi:chloramphenicol 3-O-phosphotransferase
MYSDQIPGAALTLCLLHAGPDAIKERFLRRGWNSQGVGEAAREVAELEHATFADLRVDTGDLCVEEVARMVRVQAATADLMLA